MIYRNVTKFVGAAFVAALLVGTGGMPVVAQQSYGSGCTSCASCSQTISFPSSNISSMPVGTSQVTYPAGQVVYSSPQLLPTTSSFVGSTVQGTVINSVPGVVYGNQVNESFVSQPLPVTTSFAGSTVQGSVINSTVPGVVYGNQVVESYPTSPTVTYPTATYATGNEIVSQGQYSQPVGTFTSIPATSFSSAPSTVYVQPTVVTQPVTTQPVYYPNARTPVRSTYRAVSNSVGTVTSGLAQSKAQRAANGGIRGHLGGGLGGARYEGVGWSNQSPQAAIQQCCYWGTRPTAQIGVSQGADGVWYACVLYN